MHQTRFLSFLLGFCALTMASSAHAIELNWSGQFWSELHFVNNYTMNSNNPAYDNTLAGAGGYYIRPGGTNDASFQTLFLRLDPKLVVNDNVEVRSEWWLGDPVFGIFGNAVPYSADQRQFYSTNSRGSTISAQRFWLEVLTDVGKIHVGRAPLNWGLGIVWNPGDGVYTRYQSTGDVIRLVSKFGSFSFVPAYVNYSAGNNVGGNCLWNGTTCVVSTGGGGVSDYSLQLKYENVEEDFDLGLNFIRRIGAAGQPIYYVPSGTTPATAGGMTYNIWDVYGSKRLGPVTIAAEVPFTSGSLAGSTYSTMAIAGELKWKASDSFETMLLAGRAPGQPNGNSATPAEFKAFHFHPNYHIGNILFNYQLNNFAGPNTQNGGAAATSLASPWDNPISNAFYAALNGVFKTQRWAFNVGGVYAQAAETAATGQYFYNTWTRSMVLATQDQSANMGFEVDAGAAFQWDDHFQFRLDLGLLLPGDFFRFTNTATLSATDPVFSAALKVGVGF